MPLETGSCLVCGLGEVQSVASVVCVDPDAVVLVRGQDPGQVEVIEEIVRGLSSVHHVFDTVEDVVEV